MPLRNESVHFILPVLQLFYVRVLYLYDLPARAADKMVVVLAAVKVLIAGRAVLKTHFPGKPAFAKEFKRAVYGNKPDRGEFSLYGIIKLLGGHVLSGFQKGLHYVFSLFALFKFS